MDPNDMPSILAIIDRLIAPIVNRLDQMDAQQRTDAQRLHSRLDEVAGVAHKIAQHETTNQDHANRLGDIEDAQQSQALEMAKIAGRNEVIVWVLGIVGGPITVALCLAGIAKLFNIDLGV